MPPKTGNHVLDKLQELAPRVPVNQAISFRKYCHSAQLLLNQANDYGRIGDLPQRCLFLTRLASLVIETIPHHKDFSKTDREYVALKEFVYKKGFQEAEDIKEQFKSAAAAAARAPQPPAAAAAAAAAPNRRKDGVQIGLSNLDGIDWGSFAPEASVPIIDASYLDELAHPSSAPSAPPASTSTNIPSAAAAAAASRGALGPPRSNSSLTSTSSGSFPDHPTLTTYQSSFTAPSSSSLQKHALFGARSSGSGTSSTPSNALVVSRPRYPEFDTQPASSSLLDDLWKSQSAAAVAAAGVGGRGQQGPLDGALEAMSLAQQQQQQQQRAALAIAMQPSAGPSLGPQEVEVATVSAHAYPPQQQQQQQLERRVGTCSEPPPPDSFLHTEEGGPKPLPKRMELRTVHISMALMNDFLHFANRNTKRGIESCGILAGSLSEGDAFLVTTLIVPKQEGTSDTVAALNEEEIFEAQFSRGLYPLGWIHTHPTQTCFLSSVDVHTQCGYQTMLDEAVAIVMAPQDRKNKVGIFRLTTPGGLSLIQRCNQRGFHPHPATDTGQDLYELCGHVFLNPGAKHEVLDLR